MRPSRGTWRWCTNRQRAAWVGRWSRILAASTWEMICGCRTSITSPAVTRSREPDTGWRTGGSTRSLRDRGSLTVWVTPDAIAAWHPARTGRPGRSAHYSDLAIETGVMLRLAFARPWRQTEGLLRSVTTLLGLSLDVPDHTTRARSIGCGARSIRMALCSTSWSSAEETRALRSGS